MTETTRFIGNIIVSISVIVVTFFLGFMLCLSYVSTGYIQIENKDVSCHKIQ